LELWFVNILSKRFNGWSLFWRDLIVIHAHCSSSTRAGDSFIATLVHARPAPRVLDPRGRPNASVPERFNVEPFTGIRHLKLQHISSSLFSELSRTLLWNVAKHSQRFDGSTVRNPLVAHLGGLALRRSVLRRETFYVGLKRSHQHDTKNELSLGQ
jgi:hypothetical protein